MAISGMRGTLWKGRGPLQEPRVHFRKEWGHLKQNKKRETSLLAEGVHTIDL